MSTSAVYFLRFSFTFTGSKSVTRFGGTNINIPVRGRTYNTGSYSYLAASRTLRKTHLKT